MLFLSNSNLLFQLQLDYAFNENCNEVCNKTNSILAHVTATGPNDVIHYLWDFTENPTIFVIVTSLKSKLKVNWADYLAKQSNSLNFTEEPIYSLGISMERVRNILTFIYL